MWRLPLELRATVFHRSVFTEGFGEVTQTSRRLFSEMTPPQSKKKGKQLLIKAACWLGKAKSLKWLPCRVFMDTGSHFEHEEWSASTLACATYKEMNKKEVGKIFVFPSMQHGDQEDASVLHNNLVPVKIKRGKIKKSEDSMFGT